MEGELQLPEEGLQFLAPRFVPNDVCRDTSCADVYTPCRLAVNADQIAVIEVGEVEGPTWEACEGATFSSGYWRVEVDAIAGIHGTPTTMSSDEFRRWAHDRACRAGGAGTSDDSAGDGVIDDGNDD